MININKTTNINKFIFITIILIVPIILRLLIIYKIKPLIIYDSQDYINLAKNISSRNFDDYGGNRTPVYSIFITIFKMNYNVIRIVQIVMGLSITILLTWMTYTITRIRWISLIAGLFYGWNIIQIFFENMIMTETLTTFWMTLSMAITIKITNSRKDNKSIGKWILLAGLFYALSGFTRPLFMFMPFLVMIAYIVIWPNLYKKWIIYLLLPSVILMGGWSIYNKYKLNYFGLTTTTGYNLLNHSGAFIEMAPDRYSLIKDLYVEARSKWEKSHKDHMGTISLVRPVIMERMHISYAELSSILTKMSLEIFIRHPILYGKSVMKGFTLFWYVSGPKRWKADIGDTLPNWIGDLIQAERILLMTVNMLFLLIFIFLCLNMTPIIHKIKIKIPPVIYFMSFFCMVTAIIQACMDYGANNRFIIPIQPLIAFIVISSLAFIIKGHKTNKITVNI